MTKQDAAPKTRTVLVLALRADVDPRTARNWLLGKPVRGRTGDRIEHAAKDLGFARSAETKDAA